MIYHIVLESTPSDLNNPVPVGIFNEDYYNFAIEMLKTKPRYRTRQMVTVDDHSDIPSDVYLVYSTNFYKLFSTLDEA